MNLTQENQLLYTVLADAEASLRMGNINRMSKVVFVWSQRRDHLLAGEETWADQRIGPLTFGGEIINDSTIPRGED